MELNPFCWTKSTLWWSELYMHYIAIISTTHFYTTESRCTVTPPEGTFKSSLQHRQWHMFVNVCLLSVCSEWRVTLCEQKVGHERSLERRLTKLQTVWNLTQQQLHHDQQLMNLHTHTQRRERGELSRSASQHTHTHSRERERHSRSAWSPLLCVEELYAGR